MCVASYSQDKDYKVLIDHLQKTSSNDWILYNTEQENSYKAIGLQDGDTVILINDIEITGVYDLSSVLNTINLNEIITLTIERSNALTYFMIQPDFWDHTHIAYDSISLEEERICADIHKLVQYSSDGFTALTGGSSYYVNDHKEYISTYYFTGTYNSIIYKKGKQNTFKAYFYEGDKQKTWDIYFRLKSSFDRCINANEFSYQYELNNQSMPNFKKHTAAIYSNDPQYLYKGTVISLIFEDEGSISYRVLLEVTNFDIK